ncbi:MAG: dihydroorotase [Bacteroidota bacterium]
MKSILIKETTIINEGKQFEGDLFVKNGRIERIDVSINAKADIEISGLGKLLMPGIIDDQVHFREPGLTHKADLYTEPRAAVAGGVTTFMEMPNTKPPALTQEKLQSKYDTAAEKSLANFSFFMGVSNDNLEEVLKTNQKDVCGIKIFMGSSTGNMLVDNPSTLQQVFAKSPMLIATHCEDEATILANAEAYREKFGEDVPIECHPEIRNAEGCLISSRLAIDLAKRYGTRLHILHISTADELPLFEVGKPISEKRITSEVCVHHLHFTKDDYPVHGTGIKCNPAIKASNHKEALWEALLEDRLDIIATDHAPHTSEEKANKYFKAPSGVPLVQHSLNIMLSYYQQGKLSLDFMVKKMCHDPAICFQIRDRGFLREGYWADLALVDLNKKWMVEKDNIHYKCNWSPFEGHQFTGQVTHTIVSGHLAYANGQFNESQKGSRIKFDR